MRAFDFYARLEDNFEKAGYDKRSRDLIEDYTTAILLPSYESCVRLLSKGNDGELLRAMIHLLQFAKNSASESFSNGIAAVFIANPKLVESVVLLLPPEERRVAYNELKAGWHNQVHSKRRTQRLAQLERTLERLKPRD